MKNKFKSEPRVYCTLCEDGRELFDCIVNDEQNIPESCKMCYPYNPEDCFPFIMRKMYRPAKEKV